MNLGLLVLLKLDNNFIWKNKIYGMDKNIINHAFQLGVDDVDDKMWFHNLVHCGEFLSDLLFCSDYGIFVASFTEYFIDCKDIPSSNFYVEDQCARLAVLFYSYYKMKEEENIASQSEALKKAKGKDKGLVVKYIFEFGLASTLWQLQRK
ncbi:uncharacterized protein LOC133805309 [Humulus lupulus]|uniref:uncharacterized protein LOC133805309 n=1 Tax=Humulus lupulus TaxID=3486 RepID=UPI002B40382F|nr:uncharacterized protein LOC133805309 [Humulus lupulus]